MTVYNATRGACVAKRTLKADRPWSRAKGLLGRSSLGADEAMWISPCAMIHTFFMRFPIDVAFLDKELRVVKVVENLVAWRVSAWVPGAHSVLETAAGVLKDKVGPGDRLEIRV